MVRAVSETHTHPDYCAGKGICNSDALLADHQVEVLNRSTRSTLAEIVQ